MLPWIKLTCDLAEKWQTAAIRRAAKCRSADEVIGKLYRLWRHFENQSDGGHIPRVTAEDLDLIVGKRGFAAAVASVGWLDLGGDGATLPRFDRHMGAASRTRDAAAERQGRYRGRDTGVTAGVTDTVTEALRDRDAGRGGERDTAVTQPSPQIERESKSIPVASQPGETPPPPVPPVPSDKPAKAKKPAKAADPNHKPAVSLFCEAWKSRYGVAYTFDRAKDPAAVGKLLDAVGGDLDKLRVIVGRYFANSEAFFNAHPLWLLASQFTRFTVDAPPVRAGPKSRGEVQDEHTARLILDAMEGDD